MVSSVSILAKNDWTLVPYTTNMAHEPVNSRLIGFKLNDTQTTERGNAETLALPAPWRIAEDESLPINYDAVVSAVSQPITEQDVLSVVFVLKWAEEQPYG